MSKRLEPETPPHVHISTLLACRLIHLKEKDSGIKPVCVGEWLRRVIGETMKRILKEDIVRAMGTLRTCTGLESGIEADLYSVRKSSQDENIECLLLVPVDAENALNKLNRKGKHQ